MKLVLHGEIEGMNGGGGNDVGVDLSEVELRKWSLGVDWHVLDHDVMGSNITAASKY